jgi:hypothetical protein
MYQKQNLKYASTSSLCVERSPNAIHWVSRNSYYREANTRALRAVDLIPIVRGKGLIILDAYTPNNDSLELTVSPNIILLL